MCTARAVPEMSTVSHIVRDAILEELAGGPKRPTELLAKLGERFTDFEVKEELLALLNDGRLVLTSDRRLKLSEAA